MKHLLRLCAVLLLTLMVAFSLACGASAVGEDKELTILFTRDTHDHFPPVGTETGGASGGYVRLAHRRRRRK